MQEKENAKYENDKYVIDFIKSAVKQGNGYFCHLCFFCNGEKHDYSTCPKDERGNCDSGNIGYYTKKLKLN